MHVRQDEPAWLHAAPTGTKRQTCPISPRADKVDSEKRNFHNENNTYPHLSAVMQHRMMKEAQRAMAPWMGGQPLYAPMSQVSQMNPLLYSGTNTHIHTHTSQYSFTNISCITLILFCGSRYLCPPGSASGKSIPMKPMPLPPPQSSAYSMPAPSMHSNPTPANTNHMLDYLENQVRGMDMTSPLMQVRNLKSVGSSHYFAVLLFKC